tara:strand:- start:3040 stop:3462 length:423 start_codon:yes stop_codon:yes gene_type:complete
MESEHLQDFLGNLSAEQKEELIRALKKSEPPAPKQEKEQPPPVKSLKEPQEDFTMKIKKDGDTGRVAGVPVNEMARFNKFSDDGSDHKDNNNTTPEIALSERRRPPFKKVSQLCTRCSKTFDVHPHFARDFYICDSCLKK